MGGMIRNGAASRRLAAGPHLRATTAPLSPAVAIFAGLAESAEREPAIPLVDRARAIYAARRQRDAMLGAASAFFHDPAWDIMLDLFIQTEDQQIVSVSSACVGACVAHTTALRCLKAMERKGVVSFRHDPFDKRRRFVSLTVETHRRIASWLAEV
jgi:hypothetical protein